jgi:hypothetical protein
MRRRAREEPQCCICLRRLRSARLLPREHTFRGRCIDRAAACEPGCRCPLCKRAGSSRGFRHRAPPIDAVLRVARLLATEGGSDSPEPTSGDDGDTSTPDDFAPPPPSAPSQPLFDGAGVFGDAAVASAATGSTVSAPATVTDGLCVVGGDHVINTPGPQAALALSSSPSPGSELLSTTTSPLAPAGAVRSLCGTDPADVETVKEILVSTPKRFPNVAYVSASALCTSTMACRPTISAPPWQHLRKTAQAICLHWWRPAAVVAVAPERPRSAPSQDAPSCDLRTDRRSGRRHHTRR